MRSFGQLARACGVVAMCLASPVAAQAVTPAMASLVAQAGQSTGQPATTYTPIRASGPAAPSPVAPRTAPAPPPNLAPAARPTPTPATAVPATTTVSPTYSPWGPPAVTAPSAAVTPPTSLPGPSPAAGLPAAPAPAASPPATTYSTPQYLPYAPPVTAVVHPSVADDRGATTVAKRAVPQTSGKRGIVGFALDLGMPDGVNLGLLLAPTRWLRLGGAAGSNTAGLDYRGGIYLVPAGWGPSFNFELGHCTMAQMNSLLGEFFSVSKWTKPYVQEIGYTYFNAHVGFDYPVGSFSLFVHGGYTYLAATVRGPDPVVVGWNNDSGKTPNMTVTVRQDGDVYAHTLSAKLGVLYMFGGI